MKTKIFLLMLSLVLITGCSMAKPKEEPKNETPEPAKEKPMERGVKPQEDEEPLHGAALELDLEKNNLEKQEQFADVDPHEWCKSQGGLKYCSEYTRCYDPDVHYCCWFYSKYTGKRYGKLVKNGQPCTAE